MSYIDKEKQKASTKSWRKRNPLYWKSWKIRNPEKYSEIQKRYRERHLEKIKLSHKKSRDSHPGAMRNQWLKSRYHITSEDVERMMIDQSGRCPICGIDLITLPSRKRHVDHDHDNNYIRGILCQYCNSMIGFARDNPHTLRYAAQYLEGKKDSRKYLVGKDADIHQSVKIGDGSVVWSYAVIREGSIIGTGCVIGDGVYIGKDCNIGNNVHVQSKAHITERMIIEDNVFVGQNATTTDDAYPVVNNPNYRFQPPHFEAGCSVGANSVILPGVRIGKGALIGAGSIVTKDVPPGAIIYGVAAKARRKR